MAFLMPQFFPGHWAIELSWLFAIISLAPPLNHFIALPNASVFQLVFRPAGGRDRTGLTFFTERSAISGALIDDIFLLPSRIMAPLCRQ